MIDRDIVVEVNPELLPADAVRKGYSEYIAGFPAGELSGHFGAGVRSLINILNHLGSVTEGRLGMLMKSFGVQISGGTISNSLKSERGWAVEEQTAILQVALHRPEPKQMDSTGNVQKGVNKTTHIIASSFFTVFIP